MLDADGACLSPSSKPHICEHCNAAFRSSYHLRRHVLIHTGERLSLLVSTNFFLILLGFSPKLMLKMHFNQLLPLLFLLSTDLHAMLNRSLESKNVNVEITQSMHNHVALKNKRHATIWGIVCSLCSRQCDGAFSAWVMKALLET